MKTPRKILDGVARTGVPGRLIMLAVALATVSHCCAARAAAPEVRGTWLTTTGPNHIQSGINTPSTMSRLSGIGLNTVYVETWKNGYTNYPSQRLAGITGGADRSTFLGTTRDLVQETLIHAHRNQLAFVGWFEYGFAAQFIGSGGMPNNPLATYMKNRGWLLQNQSGQYGDSTNGYAWMNPAVPEVRQLLIDLTLEAVNRYDLDGIQFDDRLSWPVQFGFDATTLSMYSHETGLPTPTSATNTQFRQWRQGKVTQFAQELRTAVKAARPELLLSIAPSITSFSTTDYNANWPLWQDQGIFDEYAVQAYRANLSTFSSIIDAQVAPFEPDDHEELVVGLRINGTGANTTFADLQAMIERTRTEGAAGHSLWYSSGVLDSYAGELATFYDVATEGRAENPRLPSGHRPAPISAALALGSDGEWAAEVVEAGRYRLVGKIGSFWKELAAAELPNGQAKFVLPGVTQLELLVDHRTATSMLGDVTHDGVVDGADFLLWQRGPAAVQPTSAGGDANRDGVVDASDLLAWKLNYAFDENRLAGGRPVPESATAFQTGIVGLAALVYAQQFLAVTHKRRNSSA